MADLQAILKKRTQLTPKLPSVLTPATELKKSQPCTRHSGNQISFSATAEIIVSEEDDL